MGLLGASAALHVLGAGSVHGQPPLLLPISKPSECDSEVPLRGSLVHSAQVEGCASALRTGQGALQASPPTYNVACAQHQLEKHFPTPAQELELLLIPGNVSLVSRTPPPTLALQPAPGTACPQGHPSPLQLGQTRNGGHAVGSGRRHPPCWLRVPETPAGPFLGWEGTGSWCGAGVAAFPGTHPACLWPLQHPGPGSQRALARDGATVVLLAGGKKKRKGSEEHFRAVTPRASREADGPSRACVPLPWETFASEMS